MAAAQQGERRRRGSQDLHLFAARRALAEHLRRGADRPFIFSRNDERGEPPKRRHALKLARLLLAFEEAPSVARGKALHHLVTANFLMEVSVADSAPNWVALPQLPDLLAFYAAYVTPVAQHNHAVEIMSRG